MNNETKKSVLIYLLFSFLLTWVPTVLYLACGGTYESGTMQLILGFSMICPSIAVLITRLLTGEGFLLSGENSLLLGLRMSEGKWKWYVFAIVSPILYWELGMLLFYLLFPESFDPTMIETIGIPKKAVWMYPFVGITSSVMVSFGALGEELGWRGYMMPKLKELFGMKKAVLLGGIIWGVWHYPALYAGHNFGTDYFGKPWTGFLVFTILTIFMGAILTLVTEKTGSIWPAAFMHAVHNSSASILTLYYNKEYLTGIATQSTFRLLVQMFPMFVIGAVCIYKLTQSHRR